MFSSKLKNAIALAMVILALTAGAGAWRYAAVAGQAEERRGKKSIPSKTELPKVEEPRDRVKGPPIPVTKRTFRIDLLLTEEKNGRRKVLSSPRKIALEGKEACFRMGPGYLYTFGQSQFEDFVMGPNVYLKVHSAEGGQHCLLMTVSQPTLGTFGLEWTVESRSIRILRRIELGQPITARLRISDKDQNTLEVTAAVQEAEKDEKDSDANTTAEVYAYASPQLKSNGTANKDLDANTIAAAEKDLQIANFWLRTGHPDSARFYYELVRRRYPNTIYDARAKERLAKLKEKPPARVGQIFLIGNEKISDTTILEQLPFCPGQILSYPDLSIAEQNLSRLKGLKSKPIVTVIDQEGDSEFKDIEITVEEK